MHIDWLTEIHGAEYGYVTGDGSEAGSLVVRDEAGDTMLPPYQGRFTVLEDVDSREEALDAARAWEAQRGTDEYAETQHPDPDPAAHRRALAALAAAEAAHRRATEAGAAAEALRIERSALIRAARESAARGELLEEIRALDARIEELEREASIERRAAEAEAQRHYRAIEACGWSVDDA